jgi:hypothetical protein
MESFPAARADGPLPPARSSLPPLLASRVNGILAGDRAKRLTAMVGRAVTKHAAAADARPRWIHLVVTGQ